jgi:predicted DNA-binding transcriptional regulator AlpA
MSFKIIRPYQLAEMLGVHRATIHRMEKRGELPPRKQFSKRLIGWDSEEIHEWYESRDKDISEVEEPVK